MPTDFIACIPGPNRSDAHGSLVPRCRRILEERVRLLESSPEILKIPLPLGERRRIPDAPFHLYPELFFQLSGTTSFRMPESALSLLPGEICLMPRFIPHRERASATGGKTFLNMVVMFNATSVSFHTAGETGGKPFVLEAERFENVDVDRLTGYLDDMVDLASRPGTSASPEKAALRHLSLSFLFRLLDLLTEGMPVPFAGNPKIIQAKKLIEINISDPRLSVKTIASWIRCSPDYLSHLFKVETGEALIGFMNRKRVALAVTLLEGGRFNISETAWACGFDDPAYFCRVFRNAMGIAPQAYRKKIRPASAP